MGGVSRKVRNGEQKANGEGGRSMRVLKLP